MLPDGRLHVGEEKRRKARLACIGKRSRRELDHPVLSRGSREFAWARAVGETLVVVDLAFLNSGWAAACPPSTARSMMVGKFSGAGGCLPIRHGRDSYVFGSSAMSQANAYFFARKRQSFFFGFFFARKREKKNWVFWGYFLGIFWVVFFGWYFLGGIFWVVFFKYFLVFGGICFCFSRVSAKFFWVFFSR